jgi:outer membrane lipoprotein LolB
MDNTLQLPPFLKGGRHAIALAKAVGGIFHTANTLCKFQKSPRPTVGPLLEKGAGVFVLLCFMLGCAGCAVLPSSKQKNLVVPKTATDNKKAVTTLSDAQSSHFSVLGKASLSDGKRYAQISLRWQQMGEHYVIHLYGPLGSGAVRLSHTAHTSFDRSTHPRSHQHAIRYQDGRGEIRHYGSAEQLLEKECGWRLPIAGLAWWLRGLARPEETAIIVRDQSGLITQIAQDGWTIEYLSYQSMKGRTYPHKVRLRFDKLRLKFVLRDWHIDTKTLT